MSFLTVDNDNAIVSDIDGNLPCPEQDKEAGTKMIYLCNIDAQLNNSNLMF